MKKDNICYCNNPSCPEYQDSKFIRLSYPLPPPISEYMIRSMILCEVCFEQMQLIEDIGDSLGPLFL